MKERKLPAVQFGMCTDFSWIIRGNFLLFHESLSKIKTKFKNIFRTPLEVLICEKKKQEQKISCYHPFELVLSRTVQILRSFLRTWNSRLIFDHSCTRRSRLHNSDFCDSCTWGHRSVSCLSFYIPAQAIFLYLYFSVLKCSHYLSTLKGQSHDIFRVLL
jgi:hypothetical protein